MTKASALFKIYYYTQLVGFKKPHKIRYKLSKIQTTPTETMNECDILTEGAVVTKEQVLTKASALTINIYC